MAPQTRIGGSFAPEITDELLADYHAKVESIPHSLPQREVLENLLACCEAWWELPESNGTSKTPHAVGIGTMVSLHPDVLEKLDPHIPWDHELEAYQKLIDAFPDGLSKTETVEVEKNYLDYPVDEKGRVIGRPEVKTKKIQVPKVVDQEAKDIRNMANHLLWVAVELSNEREPLTADAVIGSLPPEIRDAVQAARQK
jgi:hypothetical protein